MSKSKAAASGAASSASSGVAERVFKLAEPIVSSLGLVLWDVDFKKEGSEWYLTLYIDKEGGIDISDCENVSRAVDAPLDEADIIAQSYRLEVSSLGLDRPLKLEKDFVRFMGQRIEVKFYKPLESGSKQIEGRLTSYHDGNVTITADDGGLLEFKQSDTAVIRLCVEI